MRRRVSPVTALLARGLTVGLALGLTVGTLAGCGSESASPSGNPTSESGSPSSRSEPADTVAHSEVELVSATAAGGSVDNLATVLADADDLAAFSAQFRGEMPGKLQRATNRMQVADGEVLVGAVVWIGCDVPPGVRVTSTEFGVVLTAEKILKPMLECFAPVTTVALVSVDAEAVPDA